MKNLKFILFSLLLAQSSHGVITGGGADPDSSKVNDQNPIPSVPSESQPEIEDGLSKFLANLQNIQNKKMKELKKKIDQFSEKHFNQSIPYKSSKYLEEIYSIVKNIGAYDLKNDPDIVNSIKKFTETMKNLGFTNFNVDVQNTKKLLKKLKDQLKPLIPSSQRSVTELSSGNKALSVIPSSAGGSLLKKNGASNKNQPPVFTEFENNNTNNNAASSLDTLFSKIKIPPFREDDNIDVENSSFQNKVPPEEENKLEAQIEQKLGLGDGVRVETNIEGPLSSRNEVISQFSNRDKKENENLEIDLGGDSAVKEKENLIDLTKKKEIPEANSIPKEGGSTDMSGSKVVSEIEKPRSLEDEELGRSLSESTVSLGVSEVPSESQLFSDKLPEKNVSPEVEEPNKEAEIILTPFVPTSSQENEGEKFIPVDSESSQKANNEEENASWPESLNPGLREYDPEGVPSRVKEIQKKVAGALNHQNKETGDSEKLYNPLSPPVKEGVLKGKNLAKEPAPRNPLSALDEKMLLNKIRSYTGAPYPYGSVQEALYDISASSQPGRFKKGFSEAFRALSHLIRSGMGEESAQDDDFRSFKPVRAEAQYLLKRLEKEQPEGPRKSQRMMTREALRTEKARVEQAALSSLSDREKAVLQALSYHTDGSYTSLLDALKDLENYKQPGRLAKDSKKAMQEVFQVALSKIGKEDERVRDFDSSVPARKEAARIRQLLEAAAQAKE